MPTYADGYTPVYRAERPHTPQGATSTGFPLTAEALTPSDTTEYPQGVTVWANAAGDVAIESLGAPTPVTFTLAAGQCLPCLARRVLASGAPLSGSEFTTLDKHLAREYGMAPSTLRYRLKQHPDWPRDKLLAGKETPP